MVVEPYGISARPKAIGQLDCIELPNVILLIVAR